MCQLSDSAWGRPDVSSPPMPRKSRADRKLQASEFRRRLLRWFRSRHGSLLTRAVRRPRWAYAAIGVALIIGVAMFPFLDRSTNVRLRETDLLIRWDAAPGTSLPAMNGLSAGIA